MSSSKQKTILIIDDDDTLVQAIKLLFEEEGYLVHHLASGHSLQEWLDVNRADLVLVDFVMPGQSGAQVTEILRKRKNTRNVPIIMLAASRFYDKAGYQAGIDKFIEKPFDIDDLLRQVKYYLDE